MTDLNGQRREYVLGQHLRVAILTAGTETDGRHDLVEARTPPGDCTPLHLHTRYEERLFVLDGELTVWAGADRVTLGPGGFYTVPTQVPHMIQTGKEGARALLISSPAGFAELIERTARLAGPDVEIDMDLFMKVTTELGDVVLGPPGTIPSTANRSSPGTG
jgi:mannose-6-phosphate isomerase-like protein (cupin superfamily)